MDEFADVSLAGGVLSMAFPASWRGGVTEFDEAHYKCAIDERLGLSVVVECFEVPEDIRNNRIDSFLFEKGMPRPEITAETDITAWTVRYTRAFHDRPLHERVWRRAHVASADHLRVATWTLSVPITDREDETADRISDFLDEIVEMARFAESVLPADRIAPSRMLKRTALWDVVLMRIPVEWTRERQHPDGTGMYCIHEEGAESGTLWVDYDVFRVPDPGMVPTAVREWAQASASESEDTGEMQAPLCEEHEDGYLVRRFFRSEEDGEGLRHYSWHRFVAREREMMAVHFTLVFLDRLADVPEFIDRLALFDREIRNAILLFPPA